jgi:uncharacterized protein YndB with AHSA1/START domain
MPDIRHSLVVGAPVDRVRALVATPDGLAKWWAEDVTPVPGSPAVELGFFNRTTIYRLVPKPDAAAVRWACETGKEWEGTDIVFRLQPKDQTTLVEFAHERWAADTPYFVSCNTVWGHLMFVLKDAAEHPHVARPLFTKDGMSSSAAGPVY